MSYLRLTILALLSSVSLGYGSIDYLEQRFYREESFTRISEYFGGIELSGNRTIIRSNPEQRTGHYVTFQLSEAYPVDHFKLEVYEFGAKDPKDYIFNFTGNLPLNQPIFLGLTGANSEERSKPPVAYKLSLMSQDGKSILSATSFLWGDE